MFKVEIHIPLGPETSSIELSEKYALPLQAAERFAVLCAERREAGLLVIIPPYQNGAIKWGYLLDERLNDLSRWKYKIDFFGDENHRPIFIPVSEALKKYRITASTWASWKRTSKTAKKTYGPKLRLYFHYCYVGRSPYVDEAAFARLASGEKLSLID